MKPSHMQSICFLGKILAALAAQLVVLTCTVVNAPAGSQEDRMRYERVLFMYNDYTKSFPAVKDIDSHEALQLLNRGDVVFVDVRQKEEQAVSMIPGAQTQQEFIDNIERNRNKQIIAYCTISYRSGKFAEKMIRQGVYVTNLRAGLLGWVHAGGPLVHDKIVVKQLHVYGKKWDLAPMHYSTIY